MKNDKHIEAISLGGGSQSSALVILSARGEIDPIAEVAIFSDPGAEPPEVYSFLDELEEWSRQHNGPEIIRTKREGPALDEWHYKDESETVSRLPLSALPNGGLWVRDCTRAWKIRPVRRVLRDLGAKTAGISIGISYEEAHRIAGSRADWIENRHPLFDLRLTRKDTIEIIEAEGLHPPVKSACYFCPLRPVNYWRYLAATDKETFERAAQLEDVIRERADRVGSPGGTFSHRLKPLRTAFAAELLQYHFIEELDPEISEECGGYCFT
jgi:hypothetical protein